MLLNGKIAIVHGAGGAIGGAVARAFAREGAKLFLGGRNLALVETVAKDIVASGGEAQALDKTQVNQHAADVASSAGRIDIVLNAIGFPVVQGVPLLDLQRDDFVAPIATWTMAQFLTARAAARHMVPRRSGAILTLSASPARLAVALTGGFGVACAAVEGLTGFVDNITRAKDAAYGHARWLLSRKPDLKLMVSNPPKDTRKGQAA